MSRETSYDATELEGLIEARKIICKLEAAAVQNHPIFVKLWSVERYIQTRQTEVLASTLAPEVQ
jgi:hypothetical protein